MAQRSWTTDLWCTRVEYRSVMTDFSKLTREQTLGQIVDTAQTLPPEEQLRFIREACAGDLYGDRKSVV